MMNSLDLARPQPIMMTKRKPISEITTTAMNAEKNMISNRRTRCNKNNINIAFWIFESGSTRNPLGTSKKKH